MVLATHNTLSNPGTKYKKIKLQNLSYQNYLCPFNILFSSLDIDNRNFLGAFIKKIG